MTPSRFLSVLLLLASSAVAHGAVLADQPYRLDDYNRLTTDVTINGKGPFSFALDTASSISFLFEPTRDKLGLSGAPAGEAFDTYGLSQVVKTDPLTLEDVRLSGLTLHNVHMGVLKGPTGADGILGIDMVDGYTLVLDRDQMRLKLLSAGDNGPQAWRDWSAVELRPAMLHTIGSTFWSVRAGFNDHRFTALLDLGAGITIINWAAAEQLGIQKAAFNSMGPPDKRLRDVLGATAPAINTFVNITLGNQRFSHQRVLIADAPVFDFAGMHKVPAALIGTGLLKDHSIAVDFPGRKLYIGPETGGVKSAAR